MTKYELFKIMNETMCNLVSIMGVYGCKKEDMKRIKGMFGKYYPLPEELEELEPEETVKEIKRRIGEPLFNIIYADVEHKCE